MKTPNISSIQSIITLVVMAFSLSCGRHDDRMLSSLLTEVDSLMFIAPDSALSLVESIDFTEITTEELQARYALLLTQAKIRNQIPIESDSLIRKACEYYSKYGDSERLAWGLYCQSQIHYRLDNDSLAIVYINEAAKAAAEVENDMLHYFIYFNWGKFLTSDHYSRDRIGHFVKAERYAEDAGYVKGEILSLHEIGYAYIWSKEYEIADSYFNRAIALAKSSPEGGQYLSMLYNSRSVGLSQKGDYENALACSDNTLRYIPFMTEYGDSLVMYTRRASILMELGRTDSVEYYLNKGMEDLDYVDKAVNELNFSKLEELRGNYRAALERRKLYDVYIDSVNAGFLRERVVKWQRKYDLQEIAAERNRLKIENQKIGIIALSLGFVVLIVILVAIIIIKHKENEIANMQNARNQLINEALMLAQTKWDTAFARTRHQADKMKKYILEINTAVNRIRFIQSMAMSDKIKSKSQLVLSDTEIASIRHTINLLYDDLLIELAGKNDRLTDDDRTICCLTLLNTSLHDASLLLDCSEETLRKRRYRLKEKLGISADSDLYSWLTSHRKNMEKEGSTDIREDAEK